MREAASMSRSRADSPKRLAEKLKQVRHNLGFTREQLFLALEEELEGRAKLHFGYLTRFESGSRVPSLLVLLAYARVGKVPVEALIDDKMKLFEPRTTNNEL
jgi:transcriptional regulator with XRE-family HTH domain